MIQINFKKTIMSYFLSTGDKVEHEFVDGINFIVGENKTAIQKNQKNGCGKTVIFLDSVLFALYGTVSRSGFKQADIPFNKGGKKKCIVSLDLEIDNKDTVKAVNITRSINPSKLTLTVDGEDLTQSHSKSTQEYIISNILAGVKYEIFKQAIAMDIGTTSSFLTMNKVEREKFIGGIFSMEYIKEAQKYARDDFNEKKKEAAIASGSLNTVKGTIDSIKEQIVNYDKNNEEKVRELKGLILATEKEIEHFDRITEPEPIDFTSENTKFDEESKKVSDKLNEQSAKMKTFSDKIREFENTSFRLLEEIKQLETSKTCPTCKRDFDDSTKSSIDANISNNAGIIGKNKELCKSLEAGVEKIKNNIVQIKSIEDIIQKRRTELLDRIRKYQQEKDAYIANCNSYDNLLSKLLKSKEELERTVNSDVVTNLKETLKSNTTKYKNIQDNLKEITSELEMLNKIKTIFGETGIREYILKRIIDLFNTTLNMYLERLETPCKLVFDSTFNYVMTTLGGIEIPLGSLSGGEMVRLSTAIAFTFKDILRVQNQLTFNMSIYDEWFDVSIDTRGLEIMGELLEERLDKYNESAYIITHRTDLVVSESNTIKVIKENGISRIE